MSTNSTTYTNGTVVQAAWLNDVNTAVYGLQSTGAVGDGVTDDTALLQSAINAAIAAGVEILDGGGKTYKISSGLVASVSAGKDFTIQNATLKSSGIPTSTNFLSLNGPGLIQTINISPAAQGSYTIVLASGTLTTGTIIRVAASNLWSDIAFTGTPSVTMGEWATVASAVGTTITLAEPLRYDYIISPVVEVTGMAGNLQAVNITGISDNTSLLHTAVQIAYAFKARMRGVVGNFCSNAGASFDHCYYTYSEDCGNLDPNTSLGFAYGVVTGNTCRQAENIRPFGRGCRHVSAKGGTSGVIASIVDTDPTGDNQFEGVVDSHAAVDEQIVYGGTVSYSSSTNSKIISCQARRLKVFGAQCEGIAIGISWQPSCTAYNSYGDFRDIDISTLGNAIDIEMRSPKDCDYLSVSGYWSGGVTSGDGLIVTTNSSYVNVGGINPPGQFVYSRVDARGKGALNRGAYFLGNTGKQQKFGTILIDGQFEMSGTTAGQYPLYIRGDTVGDVADVKIRGRFLGGNASVRLDNVTYCDAKISYSGIGGADPFINNQSGSSDALNRFNLVGDGPSTVGIDQHRGTFVANGTTAVTVNNSAVRTGSRFMFALKTAGGTPGTPRQGTITSGTSVQFSSTVGDTSTWYYWVENPTTGP